MSGFSAASVAPLTYDFTTFPVDGATSGERCTGRGRIPEPSNAQLAAFRDALGALFGFTKADEEPTSEAVAEAVDVSSDEFADKVRQTYADLCSGSPSADELKQLPPRIFGAFAGWLQGSFAPKA